MLAAAIVVIAGACSEARAAGDDGVTLTVNYGFSPGEVRLGWVGGTPAYRVYRSAAPNGVVAPPNEIGSTLGAAWLDTPPAGFLFYYKVAPPCTNNPYCDTNEYCDASGVCAPDQSNGSTCAGDSTCLSGHCGNGYCCATGDCCASAADCGAYAAPPVCDAPSTCQGTRTVATCNANECGSATANDDSGCAGLESQPCGLYPSVLCTSDVSQPGNQAGLCPTSCADDLACDPTAHCDANACLPDLAQGGFCDEPSDCEPGLPCADSVCCSSACSGVCQACDVPGSVGTCGFTPAAQDPAGECGGVSCVGFYAGFSGDTCLRKADVTAPQAACNGAGACRTQAQECNAQTSAGPPTITCNSNCQDPTAGTCTGTVAGACTNVNPGTQTCGTGQCVRTANQCQNGAPATCTPGAPTAETCNDLDDNCNGTIDDGAFSDGFENNPTCGTARALLSAGSDQSRSYSTMTLYPSGDVDYYSIFMTETDSSCGCGNFSFDEDYEAKVTLTVPVGAGSYQICMNTNTCSFPAGYCFEVGAGSTINLSQFLDGACGVGAQDDYTVYVAISGANPPGFECSPYTLSYTFTAGLCR